MTTTGTSREAWQNNLWTDMIDDEDADSDTDSRLSGSVIVDSVMRRLQKGYRTERSGGGGEFTLDPIADHSLEETDGPPLPKSNGVNHHHHQQHYRRPTEPIANGFQVSPSHPRRTSAPMGSISPKMPPRHLGFGGRRDMGGARDGGIMHPFTAGRRKDPGLLSPVPENFSGLGTQNKSSTSDMGMVLGRHGHFSSNLVAAGPMHHSMETVPHNHKNSPTSMHRPPPDGYRSPLSHSTSPDSLTRSHSEHNRIPSGGANISRHGSIGHSPVPSSPYHHYKSAPIGPGRSPQLPARFYHGDLNHHHEAIEHQVSGLGHTTTTSREPNLNDVVDYLSNPDPSLVANAASYLQHLAYGDDNMKAKIRQFGGIPALVRQIRNPDSRVQLAVLGALRNLSYGRANNDNKIQIASDIGLPDMGAVLKSTQHAEIRELITSVLWNLSSCDDIKLRILQCCLRDIVETILVPHSGCSHAHAAAKDFSIRPNVSFWTMELKNSLGALRNISSAGEAARKFLRGAHGLVDTLVWIVRAASGQEDVDEKTAENAMCILRNLSYQIEHEIDPQDGVDDDFDKEWERQVQQEIDEATEAFQPDTKNRKSLLLFCARPRTADNLKRNVPQLLQPNNLSTPDQSLLPKRTQPPRGTALLWQPEIVFPYLALLEKYTSTPDLMEAAAGALQNLTACSWKWSVYQRHIVRKANGLTLLIDLLNHAHDTVVRSAATALRNLATDPTNKLMIGAHATRGIIPRLPYGQNNLGISEPTTIALLCTLMEVCVDSPDNARVFREAGGIPPVVRLTQSREHTPRVIFAAHKLCSILFEFKFAKSHLKQEGWDIKDYQRLLSDGSFQLELDPSAEIQHNNSRRGSHDKERKKRNNSDPSEVNRMQQTRKDSLTNVPLPSHPTPPEIGDINDPAYHMIDNRSKSQPPKPPAPVIPVSVYAEINDPELQLVRKQSDHSLPPRSDSQAHSHTGSQPQSEPRSSPIDQHTTGSITPHEGLSSDEQTEPGNAMYAQIDYEKKRESRRRKQQERKHQPPPSQTMINPEAFDSWV